MSSTGGGTTPLRTTRTGRRVVPTPAAAAALSAAADKEKEKEKINSTLPEATKTTTTSTAATSNSGNIPVVGDKVVTPTRTSTRMAKPVVKDGGGKKIFNNQFLNSN